MTGVGTTVVGWTVIAGLAGGIYYLSTKNEKPRRATVSKQAQKPAEGKKDKAKKVKKQAVQSDGDSEARSGSEKRKNKKSEPSKAQSKQPSYAAVVDDKEDDVDNHEFARQMAAAKSGAFVAPKSKAEARAKSVKQSKAFEKQPAEQTSDNFTASSANGGDADDDQSPINSPDLSATSFDAPVGGGVADMLEKPASGPSILKISAPANPTPPKKQKSQANEAPVESKKQRQNRQKAEAAKLQRQQDEAERLKLQEQTRRNARIAEGRAAKDGSVFMASSPPANNSWSVPPSTVNGTTTSTKKVQLLDTNEPSTEKSVESEAAATKSQERESKWDTNLSEEEQIRLISENENWETVKKDKKKKTQKDEQKAGNSSADEAKKDFGVPPKIEPSGPGKKWAATLVHVDDNKNIVEREVDLQDDEWEVS